MIRSNGEVGPRTLADEIRRAKSRLEIRQDALRQLRRELQRQEEAEAREQTDLDFLLAQERAR